MNRVPFSAATVEAGANKGKARTLTFATSIAPENANGLPVSKNSKGESVVSVEIGAAVPSRIEFASADEVRSFAGEHFDTFVVESADVRASNAIRTKMATEFRKLTALPADLPAWVNSLCEAVTPAGLFVPATSAAKTGKTSLKKQLAEVATKAEEMSKEDLLAMILKLASA